MVDETYLDFALQALDLKQGGLVVEKLHRLRNRWFGEYDERDFLEPTTENRKEEKKRRDALLRKFRVDRNVPQEHMDLFNSTARQTIKWSVTKAVYIRIRYSVRGCCGRIG